MSAQLELFNWREENLNQKANDLLDALNDGLKPKEHYLPHFTIQEKNVIILIAVNPEKDIMCNVLDFDGNIPKGFDACWRIFSQVQHDLKKIIH